MGLLAALTTTPYGHGEEAGALRGVISAVSSVDGAVDGAELAVIGALYQTVPQLLAAASAARPPQASRKKLLEELARLDDERLRRQCFVLAVEVALASQGAHAAEDDYVDQLQAALRIDDAFARQVVEVVAVKYACSR